MERCRLILGIGGLLHSSIRNGPVRMPKTLIYGKRSNRMPTGPPSGAILPAS